MGVLVQEENITCVAWRYGHEDENEFIAKGERALKTLESVLKNCIVRRRYYSQDLEATPVLNLLKLFLNEE